MRKLLFPMLERVLGEDLGLDFGEEFPLAGQSSPHSPVVLATL